MFEVMKTIHMLSLLGAGSALIGGGVLLAKTARSETPPSDVVVATLKNLRITGLASIILLWITGGAMIGHNAYAMDTNFTIKIIGAAVVLVASITGAVHAARATKSGQAPDLGRLKLLTRISSVGALIAIVFAVLAFN